MLQVFVVTEFGKSQKLDKNYKNNIMDYDVFWLGIEKRIALLQPIVKWITILEGDTLGMSKVAVTFSELTDIFNKNVVEMPVLN